MVTTQNGIPWWYFHKHGGEFAGAIDHRDSLGSVQRISPGDLNLMTAGNGIAHSEYSVGAEPLHGVQLWIA